jgi:hypothetical protein
MQREILRGRYRHYLTTEERKAPANPAPHAINDRISLERMKTLESKDEDEFWVEHMLALAGDSCWEGRKEEKPGEQSDEALIRDFIHNKGIFAK